MGFRLFLRSVLVLVVALWLLPGCGLDGVLDDRYDPPQPALLPTAPAWPPTSPADVLDNIAYAHNQMDYERFWPLIPSSFLFVFIPDDVQNYPDDIPPSGLWGRSEMLTAVEHMLDMNYVPPGDPDLAIDDLQLGLWFVNFPVPSNLQGVPAGTLEAYVAFEMSIQTVGTTDFLVSSHPRFYFAPDSTQSPVTWSLWRVEDAPFSGSLGGVNPAPQVVESVSWGYSESQYR